LVTDLLVDYTVSWHTVKRFQNFTSAPVLEKFFRRELKQKSRRAKHPNTPPTSFKGAQVRHPQSRYLRATIQLRPLNSAGVAQPHFLIECEDLRRRDALPARPPSADLRYLVRLTHRQREVAHLVCEGESNQEIADEAGLSLPTVKQHVHAIFRKLEVTSRSRFIALMR
jgi:DNA-binding CsgD family transcriptional regulator